VVHDSGLARTALVDKFVAMKLPLLLRPSFVALLLLLLVPLSFLLAGLSGCFRPNPEALAREAVMAAVPYPDVRISTVQIYTYDRSYHRNEKNPIAYECVATVHTPKGFQYYSVTIEHFAGRRYPHRAVRIASPDEEDVKDIMRERWLEAAGSPPSRFSYLNGTRPVE
jgi:hypothetical protein